LRARVEPRQLRPRLKADESDARIVHGARDEARTLRPLAGDDEVRGVERGEGVDDVFETLDRLESPYVEKVRTLGRRRGDLLRRAGIAHESRQHFHVARKAELAMLVTAEPAQRDERIDVIE